MRSVPRGVVLLLIVAMLAVSLAAAPAVAHEGHDDHEQADSGPSVLPYLFGVGSVAAAGGLLAGYRFDVSREFAVGIAAGGTALAVGAVILWLL